MAIPDYQTLMLPVLQRLAERQWRMSDLITAMADHFSLTEEERRALLPSGRQTTIANRTHWSVSFLHKAGLARRVARGQYEASDAGKSLLLSPPTHLNTAFLVRTYPAIRSFYRSSTIGSPEAVPNPAVAGTTTSLSPESPATPDDVVIQAVAAIEAKVRDELLVNLLEKTPAFFERVVIDLLLAMGYGGTRKDAGETLGRSGDGGIDGVIREDRLGLDLIYVQAKRYRDVSITADQLRSFAGALNDKGSRKGVFITTSRFTADARNFAGRQQTMRIVLVDGELLTLLMVRHGIGVRVSSTITIPRLDLDYFEDEDG